MQAMIEGLGNSFLGTSNCLIALRREVEAVGTNAHELPMVYAALADTDAELAAAPYRVLRDWQEDYEGNLRVILPDTYGTSNFLKHAPDWVANWTGIRIDSKDPIEGGEEAIDWWLSRGQNPKEKLAIFSDGLDVDLIHDIHRHFHGRMRIGYGWGTLLTNDFRGLAPDGALDPISIVCKVISANGRPAVKLSDNPDQGHGAAGRDRALQARVRRRRADGAAGAGVAFPSLRGEGRSSMKIDLNCDMGEGFGPWPMGDDAAMLDIVTSANVACGFHAGDPQIMFRTARARPEQGRRRSARIPGFNDLWGFGRRVIRGDSPAGDRAHGRLPDRRHAGASRRSPGIGSPT